MFLQWFRRVLMNIGISSLTLVITIPMILWLSLIYERSDVREPKRARGR
jgi:hypothetical protein